MKARALMLVLPLLVGCSVITPNGQIGKSSLDYNLQIEEAQNKNLLANIWRAKKRHPLYLTDISKVTGSLTRTYTLGLSLPLAHAPGYQFTTTPSATVTMNPTFDVNLLDTQDFMRGFLTPISPATFAYFWRQGWPRELLLHLMVREISIEDTEGRAHYLSQKDVRYLPNYPDPKQAAQDKLARFSDWVHYIAGFNVERCQDFVLTGLAPKDFPAVDSATKALQSGLKVSAVTPSGAATPAIKRTERTTRTFEDPAKPPKTEGPVKPSKSDNRAKPLKTTVKETATERSTDSSTPPSYDVSNPFDILVDESSGDPAVRSLLDQCRKRPARPVAAGQGDTGGKPAAQSLPSAAADKEAADKAAEKKNTEQRTLTSLREGAQVATEKVSSPAEQGAYIQALFSVKRVGGHAVPSEEPARMIVKLWLRSPEAILYYLGELARLEEYHQVTQRVCVNGFLQPIFVAYSKKRLPEGLGKDCDSPMEVEDGDRESVFIPPAIDPNDPRDALAHKNMLTACVADAKPPVEDESQEVLSFEGPTTQRQLTTLQCNGGRSMHAMNLLSQLIALQKSAKDFPTTPTVKTIGQ